jgi:hypothetical protein
VLYVQTGYRILRGDLLLACQNAKEHLELGEARNDPVVKSTACFNSSAAWLYRGEFAAARAYAEQVLELYDTADSYLYAMISPQDPQLGALINLSRALSCLGHLDQGHASPRAAAIEQPVGRLHAIAAQRPLDLGAGDRDRAIASSQRHLPRSLAFCEQRGLSNAQFPRGKLHC